MAEKEETSITKGKVGADDNTEVVDKIELVNTKHWRESFTIITKTVYRII